MKKFLLLLVLLLFTGCGILIKHPMSYAQDKVFSPYQLDSACVAEGLPYISDNTFWISNALVVEEQKLVQQYFHIDSDNTVYTVTEMIEQQDTTYIFKKRITTNAKKSD